MEYGPRTEMVLYRLLRIPNGLKTRNNGKTLYAIPLSKDITEIDNKWLTKDVHKKKFDKRLTR